MRVSIARAAVVILVAGACSAVPASASACGQNRGDACPERPSWSTTATVRARDGWSFFYQLNGTQETKLQVTISHLGHDPTTNVGAELFNAGGNQIPTPRIGYPIAVADTKDPTGSFTETLPYTGTYYLGVGADSYTLNVAHVLASDIEVPYRLRVQTATVSPCVPRRGSIASELLRSVECTKDETVLETQCAVEVTPFLLPALKYLKVLKAATDTEIIATLPEKVRPVARFLYDIYHAPLSKDAPVGFRTPAEVIAKLRNAGTAVGLMKMLPKLYRALGRHEFAVAVDDLAALAGLRSCIEGLKSAASE